MIENPGLHVVPRQDYDAQARERALAVEASYIVQAPAGSGKTELLVQRLLSLLAVVGEPENIVAITFTRKAAGEMRSRVLAALSEAAATDRPPDESHKCQRWELARKVLAHDREQQWNLLQSPGRLRIVTIDSLCHSIVRLMPWTSDLSGLRNIADDADELYAAAAHRTVQLLEKGGAIADDIRRALVHLDNGVPELEAEVVKMLRRRDQWLRHPERMRDPDKLRADIEGTLHRLVCEGLEEIKACIPLNAHAELTRLAAVAAENLQVKNPDHDIVACLNLNEFPECTPEALSLWVGIAGLLLTNDGAWRAERGITAAVGFPPTHRSDKELLVAVIEHFRGIPGLEDQLASVRELPPARFTEQQWQALETFARMLPTAVEQLRSVFVEQQSCDHSEVAGAALRALTTEGKPTDLAVALGHGIEHLLVDEFQDTSVSQVRLLEALTAGWKSGDGRTLFLVGDPMQSIYRFRQAEVGSFIRVSDKKSFGTVALESLRLEKNFRSRETIVGWVNTTFPAVFPKADDLTASAVQFTKCQAAAKDREAASAVRVYAQFGKTDEARELEASQVLETVRDLRARGEKVAILVRSRRHLFSILSALRDAVANDDSLRFQAVEIDALAEQVVIGDLRALTHALLHLGNRVAWLAILRAPWCGLSLADLHALCIGGKQETIWQLLLDRRSALSADGQSRLERFVPVLEMALAQRGRLPLRHWIEAAWISLNGPACLKDNRELEDASAFFELLDELDSGGDIESLAGLEKSIGGLFSRPDPDATDAIQVMTIHKAKGLEFDAVLLPSLGRFTQGNDRSLLLWDERTTLNGTELLMAPMKPKGGDKDPIYEFLKTIEDERGENELRRLLYVAVTRAKHELHLFGHIGCSAQEFLEEAKQPNKRSMLSLLWPALQGEFIAQAEDQLDSQQRLRIAASSEEPSPRLLHRLSLEWKTPDLPPAVRWNGAPESEQIQPDDDVTYDWAGERARRVGTVVHAVLQRIAEEGLGKWDEERIRRMQPILRSALANEGVGPNDMQDALARTQRALTSALTDKQGRWVLQERAEARNEFPLTGTIDGQLFNLVIDRTFVVDGVRWIVDYKTGSREGGDPDAFLENEVKRYREKMERYARIMHSLDPRPIRVGLYYPLMNGWREWDPFAMPTNG